VNVPRCPRCGGVVAALDICYCEEDDFDADELGLDPEDDFD